MGRSDGQRGIDTKGREEGRLEGGCSPRYLFLSCLPPPIQAAPAPRARPRRATLHVQLTGWLPDSRGILRFVAKFGELSSVCATCGSRGESRKFIRHLRTVSMFAPFLSLDGGNAGRSAACNFSNFIPRLTPCHILSISESDRTTDRSKNPAVYDIVTILEGGEFV